MVKKGCFTLLIITLLSGLSLQPARAGTADWEDYTYALTQSTGSLRLWTTVPTDKVFKDSPIPSDTGSGVQVYAAANEFEPFIVVVNPTSSGSVTVSLTDFGGGISTEIYQVKYVNITTATDYLGRTGDNPDPLWPIWSGDTINLTTNQNTAFWFNVHVPSGTAAGDYSATVTIDGAAVPISLHVFDFEIPKELHVKSQMNMSYNTILTRYGVTGTGAEYWEYVDRINEFMMDHRLTTNRPLWPGGLTSSGGGPFIDYNCATQTLSDPYGVWGFEEPAENYLDGTTLDSGVGFPSYMGINFYTSELSSGDNNNPEIDHRPSTFCEIDRSSADWYPADNPNTAYNQQWFAYMAEVEDYLTSLGYVDQVYHYMANEPQDQDDYDAVAWYSQELKKVAPNIKIAVSEEPKPEIYDHPTHTGVKVDIWIAHLGYRWDPAVSLDRMANYNEETWLYWLKSTYLPLFNPFTIDHPGEEAKLPGWYFWKHRVTGMAYYSFINWGTNPWTSPRPNNQNGEYSIMYPPSESNSNIAYGSNGHRFVPSIRLELMRDGLEDYEYFYLLAGGAPEADVVNGADSLVEKIVQSKVMINRDGNMMYNLRRLIGYYLSGDIAAFPDIVPESKHPRADGVPGSYYINFQDPDGEPTGTVTYGGHTYLKVGWDLYDSALGYGWMPAADVPDADFFESWDQWYEAEPSDLMRSMLIEDYGRYNVFEFDLPNGVYNVTVGVGYRQPRTHYLEIEGQTVLDYENNAYNEGIIRTVPVLVQDKRLTLLVGDFEVMSFINFLAIEPAAESADLTVSVNDWPDPVGLGQNLTYTAAVENLGYSAAAGVGLDFDYDAALTFVAASGALWTCAESNGTVSCDLDAAALGVGSAPDIVLTFTAPATAGSLSSTAAVRYTSNDPDTTNDEETETTTVAELRYQYLPLILR